MLFLSLIFSLTLLSPLPSGPASGTGRRSRAFIFALTKPNRAAVHFRNVPHNRQSESETTEFSDARRIGLTKAVENVRQKFFLDADARIFNPDFNKIFVALDFKSDCAVVRRKFYRVRKQIPDDLLQTIRVAGI